MSKYSRRAKTQERKNKRSAFFFFTLTIIAIMAFIFFGLPAIAKFAAFLNDFRTSTEPVESTDTTPPPPPRLSTLPNATNSQSLEIKGRTEPGAIVVLSLNGEDVEIVANSEGEFTHDFRLKDGVNEISAKAKDAAGNESRKTTAYEVVYDNDPPELEITSPEDKAEFFGAQERQVTIQGRTEEGAKVTINSRQVVVENDGTFRFATTLSEGENKFTIKAEDTATNSEEKEITLYFAS